MYKLKFNQKTVIEDTLKTGIFRQKKIPVEHTVWTAKEIPLTEYEYKVISKCIQSESGKTLLFKLIGVPKSHVKNMYIESGSQLINKDTMIIK